LRVAVQLVDERRRRGEPSLETVLDGAVGDRDGEVRLAGATGAAGDEAQPAADELGAEDAAEQGQADAGLEGEVQLLDHLALEPGLEIGPMTDAETIRCLNLGLLLEPPHPIGLRQPKDDFVVRVRYQLTKHIGETVDAETTQALRAQQDATELATTIPRAH